MTGWIQSFDESVLYFLHHLGPNEVLQRTMAILSSLGDGGILWVAISAILLLFRETRKAGCLALVAMLVCFLGNDLILKPLVGRLRPFATLDWLNILIYYPDSYSFPSGHTCISFAAAGSYCFHLKQRWIKISSLGLACLMGFSRLYVGVHYPSDVLVGACLGLFGAWVVVVLYAKIGPWLMRGRRGKKT